MDHNIGWFPLVGAWLLACNNPAPFIDTVGSAGAPSTLDSQLSPCELGQRSGSAASAERSHGLYSQLGADAAAQPIATGGYAGGTAACADSLAGSYGVRVELDVYVQDVEHDPGRGRASLLLRANIAQANSVASAEVELQLCGLALPPRYVYASSGVTQFSLPDEVWDRPNMPVWRSHIHASGGSLQLDGFPLLLGITLVEPGAPWPSFEQSAEFGCGSDRSGSDCFPDHDGDAEPGLSFRTQSQGEVSVAPYPACRDWHFAGCSAERESFSQGAEARRLFVGLRTALQLFPRFDDSCARATGSAQAADIVTRVLDCELTDGQRCSARQATIVDERAPSFHVLEAGEVPPDSFRDSRSLIDQALDRSPSLGGQLSLQRLPAGAATCSAVRAAFAR